MAAEIHTFSSIPEVAKPQIAVPTIPIAEAIRLNVNFFIIVLSIILL